MRESARNGKTADATKKKGAGLWDLTLSRVPAILILQEFVSFIMEYISKGDR